MWREVQLGSQELFITAALVERVPTGLYAKEDPVKKFANGLQQTACRSDDQIATKHINIYWMSQVKVVN